MILQEELKLIQPVGDFAMFRGYTVADLFVGKVVFSLISAPKCSSIFAANVGPFFRPLPSKVGGAFDGTTEPFSWQFLGRFRYLRNRR